MDEFRELSIDLIHEDNNPRTTPPDADRDDELEASIRRYGVLDPLLVTPNGDGVIVRAGGRRLRISRRMGLTTIPVRILNVDDATAEAIALVENIQRLELEPLDAAAAYQRFLDADPTRTLNELAAIVGKPKRYLHDILKLNGLIDEVKQLLSSGALPLDYAIEVAGIPRDHQSDALDLCYLPLLADDRRREHLRPLRELKEWIERTVRLDPRSEDTKIMLPELSDHVRQVDEEAKATILSLSTLLNHLPQDRERSNKPILARSWRHADQDEDRCEYARPGVIEVGPGKGTFLHVCIAKDRCKLHWSKSPSVTGEDPSVPSPNDHAPADDTDTAPAVIPEWQRREAERALWLNEQRPHALRVLAKRTARLTWKPALLQAVVDRLLDDEDLPEGLLPSLKTLPQKLYPQAVALALAASQSWSRDRFLEVMKSLGIRMTPKDLVIPNHEHDEKQEEPAAPRTPGRPRRSRRTKATHE